jgi:hypothetical protein
VHFLIDHGCEQIGTKFNPRGFKLVKRINPERRDYKGRTKLGV